MPANHRDTVAPDEPGPRAGEIVGVVRDLPAAANVTDTAAGFWRVDRAADGSRVWAGSIDRRAGRARVHLAR